MNRSHEASGLAKIVGAETTVCWDEASKIENRERNWTEEGGMAQGSVGLGVGR